MEAMLFSPACRSLEVLRLDEQVALTAEETGSLSRYLAAGRGWKPRELRMEHLGRGMEEGEWGEDIFPLIHALTSPLTSSSFLQVLELRGCRLRGEPIECLARALSPFSSSSSSAVPSSCRKGSEGGGKERRRDGGRSDSSSRSSNNLCREREGRMRN